MLMKMVILMLLLIINANYNDDKDYLYIYYYQMIMIMPTLILMAMLMIVRRVIMTNMFLKLDSNKFHIMYCHIFFYPYHIFPEPRKIRIGIPKLLLHYLLITVYYFDLNEHFVYALVESKHAVI